MFERLIEFFHNPHSYETPMPQVDVDHVVGALMVRAAKADKAYLFEEVETIDRVLAERHNLNALEAAKMRAACEKLEENMPNTAELTAVLRDAVGEDELENVLRVLWRVVLADGIELEVEDEVLHRVEALLGVTADRAKELHDEIVEERLSNNQTVQTS
jgi:uncharacterized tellurite resistance protein B-like protein